MARVGLLEDNSRIAKLCTMMLNYAGHQVTVYEHPRECLDALLAVPLRSEHRPAKPEALTLLPIDVLMLDLHLPDINGDDVLLALRSQPQTQALPIVFCTAASPRELTRAFKAAPQAIYVEKPFTFHILTSAITRALEEQARRATE